MYFLFFILHGWKKDKLSSRRRFIQSFLNSKIENVSISNL